MGTLELIVLGACALSFACGLVVWWVFQRHWFDPEHGERTRAFLREMEE